MKRVRSESKPFFRGRLLGLAFFEINSHSVIRWLVSRVYNHVFITIRGGNTYIPPIFKGWSNSIFPVPTPTPSLAEIPAGTSIAEAMSAKRRKQKGFRIICINDYVRTASRTRKYSQKILAGRGTHVNRQSRYTSSGIGSRHIHLKIKFCCA